MLHAVSLKDLSVFQLTVEHVFFIAGICEGGCIDIDNGAMALS